MNFSAFVNLLFLLVLLTAISPVTVAHAAAPAVVDQNAAVRYLMALGHFEPPTASINTDLTNLETSEQWKTISKETNSSLNNVKLNIVLRLLKLGAACTECNFFPDRKYEPQDNVPPFRRLRELARVVRGLGIKKQVEGRYQEALDAYSSIYRLGHHLEEDGTLIGAMVGVSFRKMALACLKDLFAQPISADVRVAAKSFLNAQRRPALKLKPLILTEKRFMQNCLIMTQKDPTALAELDLFCDMPGTASPPADLTDQLKMCSANQRVLMGAWEMVTMDFTDTATITSHINEFLVKHQYLKEFPRCPQGGTYEFYQEPSGTWSWRCSKHPSSEQVASQPTAPRHAPERLARIKAFVDSGEFDKALAEAMVRYDEAAALFDSPEDVSAKVAEFQNLAEKNVILKTIFPNLNKMYKESQALDASLAELLK